MTAEVGVVCSHGHRPGSRSAALKLAYSLSVRKRMHTPVRSLDTTSSYRQSFHRAVLTSMQRSSTWRTGWAEASLSEASPCLYISRSRDRHRAITGVQAHVSCAGAVPGMGPYGVALGQLLRDK